jgi:DNA-binding SARP family transcriptional activator
MEFRVLGPVDVLDQGASAGMAGGKQRLLLALLLANRGRPMSRDALVDALWPDRPPGEAAHALDLQISRMRKVIGAQSLATLDGAYQLNLEDSTVDADRFAALVTEAQGRPHAQSVELLREALALWRGPAFGELATDERLRGHAQALDDKHSQALEARFGAELELGRHAAIVGDLQEFADSHPLRERPQELLMLALYRCGRQADALRVYDDLRRRLATELGIDPGHSIKTTHEAIVRQEPSLGAPAGEMPVTAERSRPWRAISMLAAAAFAVAAAIVFGGLVDRDHEGIAPISSDVVDVPVQPESLAFIDVRRGLVVESIPIDREIPNGEAAFAAGRDADWIATGSGSLLQIDPDQHRIRRSTSLGFPAGGIAVGLGSVWVVAKERSLLVRVEPVYGAVEQQYPLPTKGAKRPDFLSSVAVAAGSIWIAQGEERVLRVDPRSGRTLAIIKAPGAAALTGNDEAVWVSGGNTGVLYKIDPIANAVVRRVTLDPYLCCVAVGGGYVWAMNYRVWKLSSAGHVVSSIAIDGDGANLHWSAGALWVAEGVSGQETRIEAKDDSVRTLRTGGLALYTSVRGDVATVLVGQAPPDLLAGVEGPVARLELTQDWLQPDDPALASRPGLPLWRDQVLDATCAGLVALRRAPPPLGWTVVPEVAERPTSADGQTWVFRIRPGFRFSPPSHAAVTAASMRDTIQRALSPAMGSSTNAPSLLSDLAGLDAFRSGRARNITGLSARGDKLVLRLRAPARDLPLRMTSHAFCAVPSRTPPSAAAFVSTPIPSAGPFYVAEHFGGNAAVLVRNPNYGGRRRGQFEAFLLEMGVQLPAGVDRVAGGRADIVAGSGDLLGPRSSVARQFGEGEPSGGPRWSRRPLLATHLLRMRRDGGPLADPRLRRAVALALDRKAMAAVFEDVPAARVLPPGAAGATTARTPAPDPQTARTLVGGRHVRLVFGGCRDHVACPALESLVRSSLRRAGITVRRQNAAGNADLLYSEVVMTDPDPLGFLARAGGPAAPAPRPGPARAAALAKRVDAQLVRSLRVLPFGTPTVGEFASSRIGCREALPLSWGDDLVALCPR